MTDDTTPDEILALLKRLDPEHDTGRYILNAQGEPERCPDLLTWARWYETAERHVCHDLDEGDRTNRVRVSTIFLALDHRFLGDGPPILWETLVLGGPLHGTIQRYTSRDDAFKGHQLICQRVSAAQRTP